MQNDQPASSSLGEQLARRLIALHPEQNIE